MTTVIAFRDEDRFVLGSDSAIGDDKTSLKCGPKFFESNGIIWGLCGFVVYEQALRQAVREESECRIGKIAAEHVIKNLEKILKDKNLLIEKEGFKEMKDSKFFFIENNRMYYLDEDLSYWESSDPFLVIGSGSEFALGAIHVFQNEMGTSTDSSQMIHRALEAATRFNPFVRAPYHIQEFKFSELEER